MTAPAGPGQAPAPQAQPSAPAAPADPSAQGQTAVDESTAGTGDLDRFRTENGRLRAQLRKIETDLEQSRLTQMSEQEKAVAAARADGENTFKNRYREALVANSVIAALTRKGVVAPDLAVRAMDLHDVDVDLESGHVDTSLIESKVADVLKRYPMLAPTTTPQGSAVGSIQGGDQRRVTDKSALKPGSTDLNETLRWALRGGD